ncbi:MAG: ATP-binding cassette domain-containing protein [Bacteroidales bacterium]|nr:ATP-binding cassette domain-containing protein [Bacteroidales bacterium]MBO7229044.1 ATP-binding cassette domain-containing protein [Bacteroidales bacterium]
MSILKAIDVCKQYSSHLVLDKVSMDVEEGEVFGLLGPNGAGKTTLIRMINKITAPDSGEILFFNKPIRQEDTALIGYMPEERGLYKKMKVSEQALYLAELKGLSTKVAKEKLQYWFERLEITSWWNKRLEELSKGMAQKVQFITTVLHEPKLLIFDEPFSGFDPVNTEQLKQEILNLRKNGTTIIFSTHNMSSVEEICDRIVLINNAKKILEGKVSEIKRRFCDNIFEIVTPIVKDLQLPYDCKIYESKCNDSLQTIKVMIPKGRNADLINQILQQTDLISYKELLPSMNEVFIKTVTKNEQN